MKRTPTNVPASVRQRLLNGAKERGEQFELTLVRFASERFLFRLGISDHAHRFVLKGGMLFLIWSAQAYRPTRDIDLLGLGELTRDSLRRIFAEVCATDAPADGLRFAAETLETDDIRDGQEYVGVRVTLLAELDGARIPVQVDVGIGDIVTPPPEPCELPVLLDLPPPRLRIYRRETMIAEKLHAMATLGERNTRLKDFYDILWLSSAFAFQGGTLAEAIRATFDRRRTAILPETPTALTSSFYEDTARATNWRQFLARNGLPQERADFLVAGEGIRNFLLPAWESLAAATPFPFTWQPGGPWRPPERSTPDRP